MRATTLVTAVRGLRHLRHAAGGAGPAVDWRFGHRARFAFAVEVSQAGRRVGGFAGGALCQRVQLAHWSSIQCRAVGLMQL